MKKTINRSIKKSLAVLLSVATFLGGVSETPAAQAASRVRGITLNANSKRLKVGEQFALKVKKIKPSNAKKNVVWKSNKKAVASVSKRGVVKALKAGKANITATSKYNKRIKKTCKIIVTDEGDRKAVQTSEPTVVPTEKPTVVPSERPTKAPTEKPTAKPTERPTEVPTERPTVVPTKKPTAGPTKEPTAKPTEKPTAVPSEKPTVKPTEEPTAVPTEKPTAVPTGKPTAKPTEKPTAVPTEKPTAKPTDEPTAVPTERPTAVPTDEPTAVPIEKPTNTPSPTPTPFILPADSLKENVDAFNVGAFIKYDNIFDKNFSALAAQQFDIVSFDNEMNGCALIDADASAEAVKTEGEGAVKCNFDRADVMVKWAEDNGLKVRGRVLFWERSMMEAFFYKGYQVPAAEVTEEERAAMLVDADTLKARMESYADQVISHFDTEFPDTVIAWDVVNEAIDEYTAVKDEITGLYLNNTGNFYKILGGEYVKLAFKYAKEAVIRTGKDIQLCYNDFNCFISTKTQCIADMIRYLNADEDNRLLDCMGMEGYVLTYWPAASDVRKAMDTFASLGVKVSVSELNVRLNQHCSMDDTTPVTAEDIEAHAGKYEDLFEIFCNFAKDYPGKLTNVSIRTLTDRPDLENEAMKPEWERDYDYNAYGTHSGLFTADYNAKNTFYRVIRVLKGIRSEKPSVLFTEYGEDILRASGIAEKPFETMEGESGEVVRTNTKKIDYVPANYWTNTYSQYGAKSIKFSKVDIDDKVFSNNPDKITLGTHIKDAEGNDVLDKDGMPLYTTDRNYAQAYTIWDNDYLYVMFDVNDPDISPANEEHYTTDSTEFFLDEDCGCDEYAPEGDAVQLRIDAANNVFSSNDAGAGNYEVVGHAVGYKHKFGIVNDEPEGAIGYQTQYIIKLNSRHMPGAVIGMELRINDCYTIEGKVDLETGEAGAATAGRAGIITAFDTTNMSYERPMLFERLKLIKKAEKPEAETPEEDVLDIMAISELELGEGALEQGITKTDNSDGSVTLDFTGTAYAGARWYFIDPDKKDDEGKPVRKALNLEKYTYVVVEGVNQDGVRLEEAEGFQGIIKGHDLNAQFLDAVDRADHGGLLAIETQRNIFFPMKFELSKDNRVNVAAFEIYSLDDSASKKAGPITVRSIKAYKDKAAYDAIMSAEQETATPVPTLMPTQTPKPTPTPMPNLDYEFEKVANGIPIDVSTYYSMNGGGSYNEETERVEINDSSFGDSQGTWELPESLPEIKEGDVVTFRVQGHYYGDSGFRLWIGSGTNTGCTPIHLANEIDENLKIGECGYPKDVNVEEDGTTVSKTMNQMALNTDEETKAFDVTFSFKMGTRNDFDFEGKYPNLTIKYLIGKDAPNYISGLCIKNIYYINTREPERIELNLSDPDSTNIELPDYFAAKDEEGNVLYYDENGNVVCTKIIDPETKEVTYKDDTGNIIEKPLGNKKPTEEYTTMNTGARHDSANGLIYCKTANAIIIYFPEDSKVVLGEEAKITIKGSYIVDKDAKIDDPETIFRICMVDTEDKKLTGNLPVTTSNQIYISYKDIKSYNGKFTYVGCLEAVGPDKPAGDGYESDGTCDALMIKAPGYSSTIGNLVLEEVVLTVN